MKTVVSSDFAVDDIHQVRQQSFLSYKNKNDERKSDSSADPMLKAVKVLGTWLS